MPTPISTLCTESTETRFLKFQKTIKDGVGWTTDEVAEKIKASSTQIRLLMQKHGIKCTASAGSRWYLTNKKTKETHATKN
jgi:hypothetical protein